MKNFSTFNFQFSIVLLLFCLCLISCREDPEILPPKVTPVAPPDTASTLAGFYLLNEGDMGSNNSTLDYFDFDSGYYHLNIYAYVNPSVPKELGDVGNDLAIYGDKLYAVINCSNKVEVMDKFTVRRLGQIDIPNCRYIRFHGGYAYVTSYAGPVEINPGYEQIGYVAKVDTATLQVVARCLTGFQPDGIEIVGSKIYVANSGGYMAPKYENTVSVIDIETFTEIKRIETGINLHRMCADRHGNLWVSSRSDYYDVPSRLYWIDTRTDSYGGVLDVAVSNFYIDGDSLYILSSGWSYVSMKNEVTYGIVDVSKKELLTRNFLADDAGKKIIRPYGIMLHPVTKDIYLTDAGNYVYPGRLICFDRYGKEKWQILRTGVIPAHFALLYK
jgi:DNA-binding beta-propeller fold protein YncE